jgi:hypothetical protein
MAYMLAADLGEDTAAGGGPAPTIVPFSHDRIAAGDSFSFYFQLAAFDAMKITRLRMQVEIARRFDLVCLSIGYFAPMQLTYPAPFDLLLTVPWESILPVLRRAEEFRMVVRNKTSSDHAFACVWDAMQITAPRPALRWPMPLPVLTEEDHEYTEDTEDAEDAEVNETELLATASALPACRCKQYGCANPIEHAAVHYCRSCGAKGCNIERHLP